MPKGSKRPYTKRKKVTSSINKSRLSDFLREQRGAMDVPHTKRKKVTSSINKSRPSAYTKKAVKRKK